MKRLKMNLILVLLIIVNLSFANKFQKGKIILENDEIRNGYLIIPNSCTQKKILFKMSLNSIEEQLPSVQIKSISVMSDKGNSYEFERQYTEYKPWGKSKQKEWLYLCSKGYANLYIKSFIYESDKQGDVQVMDEYVVTRDLPTFNYYLKKKNEEVAIFFTMTSPSPTMFGLNAMLRHNAAIYLVEYSDLVKRINDKEFKQKDVLKIVEIYNNFMINK